MATKRCPVCGAEYASWVVRCSDCAVALVAGAAGPLDESDEEQLVYELGEWTDEMRARLDALLRDDGVVFTWETTDLVVLAADEEVVDAAIRAVDPEADEDDGGDDGRGLELVYDLEALSDEQRSEVVARLAEAGVPHAWDDAVTLVVPVAAEDTVERVLDGVEFPDALPAEEVDGELLDDDERAHDVLSELFLAADRLQHDGSDREGADGLLAALEHGAGLPAPFGVDDGVWRRAHDLAERMGAGIRADREEEIREQARELRTLLRPLI